MTRSTRPAQELKIHAAILRVVGERGLGHRPIAEITTTDVAAMAHAAWRTLPEARPVERLANGSLPSEVRERAAILAPGREAAEKTPARPLDAPYPTQTTPSPPKPPSGPQGTLQRLRADPTPCAILQLVAAGHSDRTIAKQLDLTHNYVKGQVRRWLGATDSLRRADLTAWARRNITTSGPEATR